MSRIIIFILFFLIDVFTLVIIGKVKVHQIYYDKPDNTELLKNVISKNAAGRALFIFIQTLLFGSMYIEKIDKFIADENFSIALGWCFLFFMICLVLYILAIRYDSCIVKTLAIFTSSVYAILPLVYFFLKDNDPFFSTETFSKLTYVLVCSFTRITDIYLDIFGLCNSSKFMPSSSDSQISYKKITVCYEYNEYWCIIIHILFIYGF